MFWGKEDVIDNLGSGKHSEVCDKIAGLDDNN